METPYGFSAEDFERVAQAVRKAEGLPPRRDFQQRPPRGPQTAPMNWLKPTSSSTSTVNLVGGGTVQAYPAVWSYYDSIAAAWVDSANASWLLAANGETLNSGTRYLVRCVGGDVNNMPIWMTEAQGGGLALLDKTGATVDAACTSLKMDSDGVITVSNLSAGHDQLAVTDASSTQRGVVNLISQVLGNGDKGIDGNLAVNGGVFLGTLPASTTQPYLKTETITIESATLALHNNDSANTKLCVGGSGARGTATSESTVTLIGDNTAAYAISQGGASISVGVTGTGGGGDTFVGGICTGLGGAGGGLTVTDGTHSVNPCSQIDFTSGATVTNAGGGVAQVAVSGVTSTNGQSVLSPAYTVTASFADIGASIHISIPTAGTYLIFGNVNGVIQGTGGTATLAIRFTDTLGGVLANTLTETVGMSQVSGLQVPCSLGFAYRYVASGAITLTIQASMSGSSPSASIVGATYGFTRWS